MIRGIRVSEPDTLASRACFAFNRSRHLRNLYDLAFVVRLFFDRISEERKFDISNALSYFLNFPKNLHSNTGTGDYFPKKVISS